jgi:hypothetical protein
VKKFSVVLSGACQEAGDLANAEWSVSGSAKSHPARQTDADVLAPEGDSLGRGILPEQSCIVAY